MPCLHFSPIPNFKVEPAKYRFGLAGVTANLRAKVVVIDEEFPDEMLGHITLGDATELLRMGAEKESTGESEFAGPKIEADTLAFIQHSAGTTGLQKGVALAHGAVLRQIEHLAGVLKINESTDSVYNWLPLYHDMGLIACFMLPLVCHLPVVIQSPLDWVMQPETTLQIFTDCKCTLAWMPNFAFQFVPRRTPQNRWAQYDLSSVRALINCSEPVRASSMLEFQNAFLSIGLKGGALQASYAMAENVFAVTQSEINGPSGPVVVWADGQQFRGAHRIVPVAEGTAGAVSFTSSGRLLPYQEVRIASDSSVVLGEGFVGEILVKGDCLFDGYYNRPDLTAKAIIDGWYHTGDLGFCLQGELFVVGRKKDLLIIGGENIYPQDIEEIVGSHRGDPRWTGDCDGRVQSESWHGRNRRRGGSGTRRRSRQCGADRTRDPQPGHFRHGRRGSGHFPEAAEMDREKHRWKSSALDHSREAVKGTSGT